MKLSTAAKALPQVSMYSSSIGWGCTVMPSRFEGTLPWTQEKESRTEPSPAGTISEPVPLQAARERSASAG